MASLSLNVFWWCLYERLKDGGHEQSNGSTTRVNVSLEFAYERVLRVHLSLRSNFLLVKHYIEVKFLQYKVTKGMRVKVSGSLCDRRAALTMELLERLLETQGSKSTNNEQILDKYWTNKYCFYSHPANHANFFSRFSHPLLSRKVTEWREQSTVRNIFVNFLLICHFFAGSGKAGDVQAFGTPYCPRVGCSAGFLRAPFSTAIILVSFSWSLFSVGPSHLWDTWGLR